MNYKIIASSSAGNCVVINDVMVDCGVAFNTIKEYLYKIKYLLITHIHTDHVNETTLMKIKKEFPRIKIIGNHEVHQMHRVDVISNNRYPITFKDYSFTPFECVHDVVTQGFVWEYEGKKIIYATDTSSLEFAIGEKYDYLFLESNHDAKRLEQIRDERNGSYSPYLSAKRHLSTQDCRTFYYLNRRSKDSELIELHKSERFY